MLVKDIMSAPVIAVTSQEPVRRAHALMNERDIRHLPVVDGSHVVGMISERDISGAAHFVELFDLTREHFEDFLERPISQVMKTRFTIAGGLEVALQDEPLSQAIKRMHLSKLTAVPVLSQEDGPLVGILSYLDVMFAFQVALVQEN